MSQICTPVIGQRFWPDSCPPMTAMRGGVVKATADPESLYQATPAARSIQVKTETGAHLWESSRKDLMDLLGSETGQGKVYEALPSIPMINLGAVSVPDGDQCAIQIAAPQKSGEIPSGSSAEAATNGQGDAKLAAGLLAKSPTLDSMQTDRKTDGMTHRRSSSQPTTLPSHPLTSPGWPATSSLVTPPRYASDDQTQATSGAHQDVLLRNAGHVAKVSQSVPLVRNSSYTRRLGGTVKKLMSSALVGGLAGGHTVTYSLYDGAGSASTGMYEAAPPVASDAMLASRQIVDATPPSAPAEPPSASVEPPSVSTHTAGEDATTPDGDAPSGPKLVSAHEAPSQALCLPGGRRLKKKSRPFWELHEAEKPRSSLQEGEARSPREGEEEALRQGEEALVQEGGLVVRGCRAHQQACTARAMGEGGGQTGTIVADEAAEAGGEEAGARDQHEIAMLADPASGEVLSEYAVNFEPNAPPSAAEIQKAWLTMAMSSIDDSEISSVPGRPLDRMHPAIESQRELSMGVARVAI